MGLQGRGVRGGRVWGCGGGGGRGVMMGVGWVAGGYEAAGAGWCLDGWGAGGGRVWGCRVRGCLDGSGLGCGAGGVLMSVGW